MATPGDGAGRPSSPPVRWPSDDPGLLLWSDLPLPELIQTVEFADSAGYSELWYTDIRFHRDCYLGLAVAALHSRRLKLGAGVSDPYTRHPTLLATAAATLDEVSHGRALIGLGTGSALAQIGLEQKRPVRALREAIELIRAVLRGEPVQFDGEIYRVTGGRLAFAPPRTAIPIFVASHSPQVLRLSGQLADGVLLANMARRPAVTQALGHIREGETLAGRPPGSTAVHLRLETCISDDAELALAAVRQRVASRVTNTYPRWEYLAELGIEPTEAMRQAAAARDVGRVAKGLHDEHLRATTLVGSVEQAVRQLTDVLTPEIAKVTIRPLGFPGQPVAATAARFIEDVWPAVRRQRRAEIAS
jgi:5,10-methylenetetrahydromethanopterin reductase